MIPILRSKFSRPPGVQPNGKRTERIETSLSALEKQFAQIEAEAAGFANVGHWAYAVIVHEIARKHSQMVRPVPMEGKAKNSGDSE